MANIFKQNVKSLKQLYSNIAATILRHKLQEEEQHVFFKEKTKRKKMFNHT